MASCMPSLLAVFCALVSVYVQRGHCLPEPWQKPGAALRATGSDDLDCGRALHSREQLLRQPPQELRQGLAPIFRLDTIVDSPVPCNKFTQAAATAYQTALSHMVGGSLIILSGPDNSVANATASCEDPPTSAAPKDIGKKRVRVRVWVQNAMEVQQAMDTMSLFGSAATWGYYASQVEAAGGTAWPVQLFLYAEDTHTAPLCIENLSGNNCNNGAWDPSQTVPF